MLSCPAEGCTFVAKNDRALGVHISKCKKASNGLASIAEDIERYETDLRQAKRRRLLSPERLEPFPDAGGSVDIEFEDEAQPKDTIPPADVPPTDASARLTSRFGRVVRAPTRYSPGPIRTAPHQRTESQRLAPLPAPIRSPTPSVELETFKTEEDEFGRFRIYRRRPTTETSNTPPPDHNDFAESGETHQADSGNLASGLQMPVKLISGLSNLVGLFMNATIALLVQWFYSGTGLKSTADVQRLIDDVILHEDFKAEDLEGVNLTRELKKLDTFESSLDGQGWKRGTVKISVPCPKEKIAESEAVEFEVDGLLYRDLTGIIKNACQDERTADLFHIAPFKEMWNPSDDAPPIRLYGEAYTSDEMINAYEEVQKVPPHPDHPDVEDVVVELAPYSDATMLAQFGTLFLWPVYIFFGNLSKYVRCQPSSNAAHHTAYFPSLPDSFADWYRDVFGIVPSDATITHCKRELTQALWLLIISAPDFVQAYRFGMIICFADQIVRRVFPRFYVYMADYPEKVLLACIRNLGACPCPRCLIKKEYIKGLGTRADRQRRAKRRKTDKKYLANIETARRIIYKQGYVVNSKAVDCVIGSESLTPTRSAFVSVLSQFGLDFFSLFVVDFMHEFELGVWKAVFTHLIRILYTQGAEIVAEFDRRFREVPTFGLDTIRKFSNNVSAMKKLAARDFEDILQCVIPVVEGLLPDRDERTVLDLIFILSTWHSYAKLRLHTENTLASFDALTKSLGTALRHFGGKFSDRFDTKELPKEAEARKRRDTAGINKGKASARRKGTGRRFNLSTYKLHALGDYVDTIRRRGTTDSYSTQMGECEHRRVKRFYARTNHRLVAKSISSQEARQRLVRRLTKRKKKAQAADEPIPGVSSTPDYIISKPWKESKTAHRWMVEQETDPLFKDFVWNLKKFALSQLLVQDSEPTREDILNTDITKGGKISIHKTLRINYTTYDLQRRSDVINLRTRPDIMIPSPEGDRSHPYRYGRLIDIFTIPIHYRGTKKTNSGSTRREIQILWVRWFELDPTHENGFTCLRIPRVQFVEPGIATEWHGFISPSQVLRATHTIPAFSWDLADPQPCPTGSHAVRFHVNDWKYYYVNIFVDRDMFMRYRGGGVGHTYMRAIETWLAETGWGSGDLLTSTDEDDLDLEEDGGYSDGEEVLASPGNSEDETPENDGASDRPDSDREPLLDADPDDEDMSDEEDEETADGEYGFSGF